MTAFKTRARRPTGKTARKSSRLTAAKETKGKLTPRKFAAAKRKRVVMRKVGGSLMATMPADVVRDMGLAEGQRLTLAYDGGRLILEPSPTTAPARYTLGEILASVRFDLPATAEELEWENAPRVGREAI